MKEIIFTLRIAVLAIFIYGCSQEDVVTRDPGGERSEPPIEEGDDGPVGSDPIGEETERQPFVTFNFTHRTTGRKILFNYFAPEIRKSSSDKYPLIVALHGAEYFFSPDSMFLKAEERTAYMALAWLEEKNQQRYPSYVVAPNIHEGLWDANDRSFFGWDTERASDFVEKLLDSILSSNTRIDDKRVYLVGHSMGGIGAWYFGAKYKEKFAAIIPLSSAFSTNDEVYPFVESNIKNSNLKDLAIWSFIHRADANSKPAEDGTRALVKTMEEQGYTPVYTHRKDTIDINLTDERIFEEIRKGEKHFYTEYSYPCQSVGDCHFAQEVALREDFLLEWLFRQRKN